MWWLLLWVIFSFLNAKWFRKHSKLLQKINDIQWSFLVTIDIIAAFIIFSPPYLLGLISERPLGRDTISSFAGRNAALGKLWGKLLAKIIDEIFLVLANQHDHCAKESEKMYRLLNLS